MLRLRLYGAASATLFPALASLLLLANGAGQAAASAASIADQPGDPHLRNDLQAAVDAGIVPGAIALVARDGKVLVRESAGWADIESRKPLAPDTVFRLFSMSKPITSVAVMKLVERGLLDLDAPVTDHLPELAQMRVFAPKDTQQAAFGSKALETVLATRAITTRDLLSHRSGIIYPFTGETPVHHYYRAHGVMRDTPVGRRPDDAPPATSLSQLVTRIGNAPLIAQPGSAFHYSYSTTVLGLLIERITSKPLDQVLAQEIFEPLGMTRTGFYVSDGDLDDFPTLYRYGEGGLSLAETAESSEYRDKARLLDGGGALVSTTDDYLRFASMLANGGALGDVRLLSTESVASMFAPQIEIKGWAPYRLDFGLGFLIGTRASERAAMMPAGGYGWSGSGNTWFFVDPEHRSVGLVMTSVLAPEDAPPAPALRRAVIAAAHRAGALGDGEHASR